MNYTKGPWQRTNGTDVFSGLGAVNGNGVAADSNDGWQIADCMVGITFVEGEQMSLSYDEQVANAKLIAAAPELLEALEAEYPESEVQYLENMRDAACHSGLCGIENCGRCSRALKAIRAIAKAKS